MSIKRYIIYLDLKIYYILNKVIMYVFSSRFGYSSMMLSLALPQFTICFVIQLSFSYFFNIKCSRFIDPITNDRQLSSVFINITIPSYAIRKLQHTFYRIKKYKIVSNVFRNSSESIIDIGNCKRMDKPQNYKQFTETKFNKHLCIDCFQLYNRDIAIKMSNMKDFIRNYILKISFNFSL